MSALQEMFAFGAGLGAVLLLVAGVLLVVEWFRENYRFREYTQERISRAFDRIAAIESEMAKRGEK